MFTQDLIAIIEIFPLAHKRQKKYPLMRAINEIGFIALKRNNLELKNNSLGRDDRKNIAA